MASDIKFRQTALKCFKECRCHQPPLRIGGCRVERTSWRARDGLLFPETVSACSVQMSSRLCARKSPYCALKPVSQKFSQQCLWKSSNARFVWLTMSLSRPFKEDRPVFPRYGVLGLVLAGSVSSSTTLQTFRDASHFWYILIHSVHIYIYYLFGHFHSSRPPV